MPSKEERLRLEKQQNDQVADCIRWNEQQVADYVAELGYPEYAECFTTNFITGRKLIWMDVSNLPKIGVTDYNHIKHIAGSIREMMSITKPDYWRSLTRGRREALEIFLELKSRSGERSDDMTYAAFLRQHPEVLEI